MSSCISGFVNSIKGDYPPIPYEIVYFNNEKKYRSVIDTIEFFWVFPEQKTEITTTTSRTFSENSDGGAKISHENFSSEDSKGCFSDISNSTSQQFVDHTTDSLPVTQPINVIIPQTKQDFRKSVKVWALLKNYHHQEPQSNTEEIQD
jgi:hypothetical protein